MSGDMVNVKLPKELIEEIEDFIAFSEFESVEEFLIFVAEEVMKEDYDDEYEEVEFSEEDEEKVKDRLRALGYLD